MNGLLMDSGEEVFAGANLLPGTYFVEVKQGAIVRHHKLIIQ